MRKGTHRPDLSVKSPKSSTPLAIASWINLRFVSSSWPEVDMVVECSSLQLKKKKKSELSSLRLVEAAHGVASGIGIGSGTDVKGATAICKDAQLAAEQDKGRNSTSRIVLSHTYSPGVSKVS